MLALQPACRGGVRSGGALVQIGRQGDAGGLEDAADLAGDGSAGGDGLAVLLDRRLLQAVEVA